MHWLSEQGSAIRSNDRTWTECQIAEVSEKTVTQTLKMCYVFKNTFKSVIHRKTRHGVWN